ncbi:MAG: ASCH domain-containing protein [Candidatus Levyibacteriota bacterium]
MRNKSIGFAPDLVPLIKNGSKTLTYRLGDKYTFLQIGDVIEVHDSSTDEVFAQVKIIEKSFTTFQDLPIDRVGHEIYLSKERQKETFQKYYRTVHDDDAVLLLGFQVLKNY